MIENKQYVKKKKRKGNYGHPQSEETKQKLRGIHKGHSYSPRTQFKKGLIPWNKGRKAWLDPDIKERITQMRIESYVKQYGMSPEDYPYLKKLKRAYSTYKWCAKKRGIAFHLTVAVFETFWQAKCHYCGSQIKTIGIDRIDSDLGYVPDNIVAACKTCNQMKSNMSLNDFVEHIKCILNNTLSEKQFPRSTGEQFPKK